MLRHPKFLYLWRAQTISVFGSQITTLALPLTAALTLHATPLEMGLLAAALTLPIPLFALFAGVLTDRLRRRPLLIGTDLLRALFLTVVPTAALFHLLNIPLLALLGFLAGTCSIVFDVAYQPYLSSVIRPDQLVEGNGKLEASSALAAVAGPGLAGALVTLLGAPMAVAVDALSFIASALLLGRVQQAEHVSAPMHHRSSVWQEIQEGLSLVLGHELLRPLALFSAMFNFFGKVVEVSLILFATRTLGLSAALLGLIFAAEGMGGLLGAALPGWSLRRFGLGRTLVASTCVMGAASVAFPLAGGPVWAATLMLGTGLFIQGLSSVVYRVQQLSLRQLVTPSRLLGRMNASTRFLTWGVIPLGALAGGTLGQATSLRLAVGVGALGCALSFLWLVFSPVPRLRTLPVAGEADVSA